ncbi:hypothetical protein Cgig2_018848 [Carnegiea gigantea]|uniref:Protein kinase domain-containing protein n=1 Tax=Carnegiea gigantea TaxID=171969 RepID=A0A9Q1JN21_9CARY|nr:hypothetical protein Cgig2_018848 [Carnegiea gigantea]
MSQPLTKNKKKKEMKFEIKDEYFIRNGGILLEKQIAFSKGQNIGSRQVKIFSVKDMEKATDCFDPDIVIQNILGTIYKEASIGAVMSHSNLVKLYGCCLETCVPILVYEFLPNRSLFRHLHGGTGFTNLKWAYRLRVAIDISYALSYMHNALSKPVVHRAVRKNCMMEMIDKEILDQGSRDEIEQFAQLALKCVAKKGIERPTMIEVVSELWLMQGRENSSNTRPTCSEARKNSATYACQMNTDCIDVRGRGYHCKCFSDYGEIDECTAGSGRNRCLVLTLQGATKPRGYYVDGYKSGTGCTKILNNSLTKITIGLLLPQQMPSHETVIERMRMITSDELDEATNHFGTDKSTGKRRPSHHIHYLSEEFPITRKMRLQITADSSSALAYLHSSSSVTIFHRDIKSFNIHSDDKYRATLSDFWTSRSVAVDQTHITTHVLGTFGYLDPEYFQLSQFTEKRDGYSFGVVLVELLTEEKAMRSTTEDDKI